MKWITASERIWPALGSKLIVRELQSKILISVDEILNVSLTPGDEKINLRSGRFWLLSEVEWLDESVDENQKLIDKSRIKSLLFTIYGAGFSHGCNEGDMPEHGMFEAFARLINGESPLKDGVFYSIKEKVEKLLS